MMTKSGSRRAATAARIFAAISSGVDQRFAGQMAAALRQFLVFEVNPRDARGLEHPHGALDVSASPKPVSASHSSGSVVAWAVSWAWATNSVSVRRPMSGTPLPAESAPPER